MRRRILTVLSIVGVVAAGYWVGRVAERRPAWAGQDAPACLPGDTNADGGFDVSDAVFLLRHLFLAGPAPVACVQCPDVEVSTVFLIRHAERTPGADDCPDDCPKECINELGHVRAERLAVVFQDVELDHLIGSERCRTHQTLAHVSDAQSLEIESIREPKAVAEFLQTRPAGSTSLVAHHSFSLHNILEALGFGPEVSEFRVSGSNYDKLFIVSLRPGATPTLQVIRY